MENVIIVAEQDKTTSLPLSKQDITEELKICDQILYKIQLAEKVESSMLSERAEIIRKKIVEFVAEIIRNFYFKEDEELLYFW